MLCLPPLLTLTFDLASSNLSISPNCTFLALSGYFAPSLVLVSLGLSLSLPSPGFHGGKGVRGELQPLQILKSPLGLTSFWASSIFLSCLCFLLSVSPPQGFSALSQSQGCPHSNRSVPYSASSPTCHLPRLGC